MIQDGYYQFGNGGLWCDRVNDFEYKIIAKEAEENIPGLIATLKVKAKKVEKLYLKLN